MAGQLQTVTQNDFSGGLNAITSPYIVGPKQIYRVRNMILSEHGSLVTRDGYSIQTTGTDTTHPIVMIGFLSKTDLTNTKYAIQQGATFNTLYNTNTTPWTTVGNFTTAYSTPQSVTMINEDIIAAGYEIPKIFDGAALTAITAVAGQTVPPGAQHAAFHLGSLWVWNTNATTTTLDGPSSLRMSDVNNPNSWPNANQTFIARDDGQVGMGLSSFTIAETGISPTQTLVCFKNYSAYQVQGSLASSPSVQRIKSDMGCVAPRSIQFVSGFGIIRLTHKGFALYNGVDDKLISEEIRPYIFGGNTGDVTALNQSGLSLSWAVQQQDPPLYIAACPVNGNALTRFFVYDLVRKAWTICDFPINIQCMTLLGASATELVINAGTSDSGKIVKIFGGDTTDNGTAVAWSFTTRSYVVGSHLRRTYWRRAILDFLFTPNQAVTINTTLLGIATSLNASRTYTGSAVGAKWNSAVWDQFTWDSVLPVDGRQDIDIMRTAPAVYLNVSGTGHVHMRGIELQARSKPLTKAVF